MRAAEAAADVSECKLMQRAGEGAAEWVWRIAAGRAVTVLCGPGNNGGDGYVIAEWLRRRDIDVAVIAPEEPSTATARTARAAYTGPTRTALGSRRAAILVDALFGYGLSRPLGAAFGQLLEKAHASHGYCIAIDVPSGVESDTGAWLGVPFASDLTLALGAWKRAHWLMPASTSMGEKRLIDIGLDPAEGGEQLSVRPRIASPAPDSHKYRRGLVAVIGGAMPGAAVLAAEAALRAGAGNVRLLTDCPHPATPPEIVVRHGPLEEHLADERIGAVLVGPGLGRDDAARHQLAAALEAGKPCVLDADALTLLDSDLLEGVDAARLLATPHEGELARLCENLGVAPAAAGNAKLDRARAVHELTGMTVLAKGPDTILAGEGGALRFFPQGTSWLSTAGTGDVLAGIAAARVATGAALFEAASDATWLHHEVAHIAGPAFTAGELARAVRPALTRFL